MSLANLHHQIEAKQARIAVIGLGYVGLPVACMFAKAGFDTLGIDVDQERIEKINRGQNPIEGIEPGLAELLAEVNQQGSLKAAADYALLSDRDVILISVQTPVDDSDHRPRYAHMRSALENLRPVLKAGALVIIESTLAPGTMEQVILPTLEKSAGKKSGEDFWLGHCPERVTPGKLLHNLRSVNRVVGGQTPEVAQMMISLYRHIVEAELDPSDLLTAELVKTVENAYRDVQIAFANEVARICENLGGDVWKVRPLVNKSPGRNMLLPGAGVGGHCIPKDPWLLIANVNGAVQPELIPTARAVNRFMPEHVAHLTESALNAAGKKLEESIIAVLGYAYMENSDDTRDTPTQEYLHLIESRAAEVRIHDPFVHQYQTDLASILNGADAVVLMVAHDEYKRENWRERFLLMQTPVLVDARHILPDDFHAEGAVIRVLGRG